MSNEAEPTKAGMIFGLVAGVAIFAGIGVWIDRKTYAPGRARDAVIREAVLATLKSPSTAEFVEVRALQTMFTVTVDAENSFGAVVRTKVAGSFQQVCETASSRRCWRAQVEGTL